MEKRDFDRLVEQHAAFPRVGAALVEAVGNATMRAREAEGRWSPLEILAHLDDEEREDFRPRAQAAAAGRPIVTGIDPVGWVTQRAYNSKDPGQVCRDWATERERSCAWLRQLEPKLLEAAIEHPQLGRMRCGDFVTAWRMHDLLHPNGLANARAADHLAVKRNGGEAVDDEIQFVRELFNSDTFPLRLCPHTTSAPTKTL